MNPSIGFPLSDSATSGTASASLPNASKSKSEQAEIKRAAMEFEAIMLSQLTSALRPESSEDDSAFFGSGEGDLVHQLFGEHLAKALASGGGIGLADLIMRQLNSGKDESTVAPSNMERAIETVRHLRSTATSSSANNLDPSFSAAPTSAEPLEKMIRPRRVADSRNAESSASPEAVKLPATPEAAVIKRAAIDTSPRPSPSLVERPSIVITDADIESLQRMTRPRRVSDVLSVESTSKPDAVKLPPTPSPEIIKRAAIDTASSSSYTGRPQIDAIIEQASARHNVDPFLIAAVLHTESSGRQFAVSTKGASGYMQLMPATFRQFAGPGKNIFDARENINSGAAYLKFLSDKYDGNVDKILAGYNSGSGNVDKYRGVPPFRETRRFVTTVKSRYNELVAASNSTDSSSIALDMRQPVQPSGVKPSLASAQPAISRDVRNDVVTKMTDPKQTQVIVLNDESAANSMDAIDLQLPVEGRISSNFGTRRGHRHHKGVDIAAPRGTPIKASAEGEVVFAGWSRGYGKTVLIKHQDGLYTRYAHADKILVSHGDSVQSGQRIATVGSTGRATGPHLHFEVLKGNQRVNPMQAVADNSAQDLVVRLER